MDVPQLRQDAEGTLIPLRVKPRAGKNAVEGVCDGLLQVSVRAAPADGEANAAVLATLATALDCPKSALELVRGHKGREKTVRVRGLEPKRIVERLGARQS